MRLLPRDRSIGFAAHIWLIYLAFLLIEPVLGANTVWTWAVIVASLAIFFPLYFRFYWVSGWRMPALAAAVGVLGLVVTPLNAGGSTYLIFSAAMFAWASPPRAAAKYLATLLLATVVETIALGLPFWAWMPAGIGIIAVGGGNVFFAEHQRNHMRLRRAQEETEEMVKVAERERIARDLHDLLGHTLSVIVMKSELASKLADRDFARAIQEIRDVERVSREALTEVRRAVEGYQQRGLPGELHTASRALKAAGVTFETDMAPIALSPRQETTLALALRESITNVVRHARASKCRVSVRAGGGRITMTVQDDGRGGTPREGNGLGGMRARVAEEGGTLTVDGSRGMCLTVTLPLPPREAALAS